ncbi:hypothetical protein ACQY0O_005005 [Thecaphora frezii]
MDNWKPYLHTSLFGTFPKGGEPFLFPSFLIDSTATYMGAALFTAFLALSERAVTLLLTPHARSPRVLTRPAWRALLFFVATLLRYILMIVSMGMDWFLLLTIVASLSLGQYFIERAHPASPSAANFSASAAGRQRMHEVDEEQTTLLDQDAICLNVTEERKVNK